MKKILLPLVLLFSAFLSQAQTADEIVEKHLAAIGGKDAWRKVSSVVMEGSMNVMGRDVLVKITQIHNKGSRQDLNVAGMTGYMFSTPTSGWVFMPFQGQQKPEPMTPEDLKESIDDLDVQGNLLDYKQKGHSVEYLGMEDVEGTECYKLKVTTKNGNESTLFIDPANHYIIRSVSKRKAMGQEMEVKTDLSDYRDVNGVKVPFSVTQPFGTVVFSTVKINEAVDEKLFAAPSGR
ncbi:MAG: hypothetical protein MUF62_11440 [Chitinophagaceae bacterium]|nr:hypothetical protein [Chitinophagaceae bacterium]